MYDFSRGPLVWIAFGIFLIGSIYRIVSVIKLAKKDKVVLPYMTWKYGLRSILHWITPFGARNMRLRPAFTVMTYLFHLSLLLVPLFTLGHALLWQESWDIDWWALPNMLSKIMTFSVIIAGVIFVLRRIADPAVRFVTSVGEDPFECECPDFLERSVFVLLAGSLHRIKERREGVTTLDAGHARPVVPSGTVATRTEDAGVHDAPAGSHDFHVVCPAKAHFEFLGAITGPY